MHKNERVAWNVLIRNQPRPQGFSPMDGWGRPTHFFYGESLGDEVGTKGKMSFSEMRYHGRNHRIKEAFHKNNESNFFLYPSSLPFFLNLFH